MLKRITALATAVVVIASTLACTQDPKPDPAEHPYLPAATYTPVPTYTPRPTYTPLPTYTPRPTYTPLPTEAPSNNRTSRQTTEPGICERTPSAQKTIIDAALHKKWNLEQNENIPAQKIGHDQSLPAARYNA